MNELIEQKIFENFSDFDYEQKVQESIKLVLKRNNLNEIDYSLTRHSDSIGLIDGKLRFNVEVREFSFKKDNKTSILECHKSLNNDYYHIFQSRFN